MNSSSRSLRRLGAALALWLFAASACKEGPTPEGTASASSTAAPVASTAAPIASTAAPISTSGRAMPGGKAEAPRVALGTKGAISSQEAHATDVGIDVLKKGGSAVDAAIAVGFALAVTHPTAGNIGGGGFMVVRTATGESFALDYRETAPSAASRDMY